MAGETSFVEQIYRQTYPDSPKPRVFRAPGRVNLIGEHTDYNLGFVLPIAIELNCQVATGENSDGMFRVFSQNTEEKKEWPIADVATLKPAHDWSDYVIGVVQKLIAKGFSIAPQNLAIHSTVPVGSGLSSSAAIEVSTAMALLGGRDLDKVELARLCQSAEIEFVGMPCGIMDQYVSVFGEAHKAIRIDCRSVTHEAVSLPENAKIVAVNSMVKHELGSSAYRERVKECGEAVAAIQKKYPDVQALRDVCSAELEECRSSMNELVYRRARHVVTEDERVTEFMKAAASGDLRRMGDLFVASHRSLQHDYEVSCAELDYLVDTATQMRGVYGSRMTGGGFGGCTVNLVDRAEVEGFLVSIRDAYQKQFGLTPVQFVCEPGEGAREIA